MNKIIFTILIFIFGMIQAQELELNLKKDEVFKTKIRLNYQNKLEDNIDKVLTIRWTLYKNEGIVLHVKYDHFPYQFILYKDYKLNQFSIGLDSSGEKEGITPTLKIFFKDIKDGYIDSKAIATFKVYLQGNADIVEE